MTWDSGIECPSVEDTECALMKIGIPEIHFSKTAFNKIRFLVKKYPELEWLAAMTGKQYEEHKYQVEDLEIVEQEVTSVHCDVTDQGRRDLAKMPNVVGWIHSHNTMKAYQSGTDVDTSHNYPLSVTVNNKLEFAAVVKEKIECPHINVNEVFRDATVFIPIEELNFPELNTICNTKISETKYGSCVMSPGNWGENGKQEGYFPKNDPEEDPEIICIICGQSVSERKLVICSSCGETMHRKCAKLCKSCPSCEGPIEYYGEYGMYGVI